ncbi:MAG TPA: hypothetical protein VNJ01_05520 [Bacteriovoracaceae bacterium]|nr:hypothetical protein [Bacteriovoracaceae bacterium]
MDELINSVSGFIYRIITAVLLGGAVILIAAESRLVSFRKARQGSIELTSFTERMTGTKLQFK